MNIPKVSLDVMQSTTVSIADNKDFWENAIDTISIENPLLYQLLVVSNSSDNKSSEFRNGYKRGAILVYILLSRQAEADDMNEIWG
jgi:hypothetical protein